MALIDCREMFTSIRNTTRFSLILPEEGAQAAKAVLWLLPVRRGYSTDWVRYTSVELWARKAGMAVVMPEGLSSDFCNMQHGMQWWTFITDQLPKHLHELFGLSMEHNLCFGAEMGALGAVKLGLLCPERFTAAGAVGADFTCVEAYAKGDVVSRDMEAVYGERPVAEDVLNAGDPMRIAQSCAKADTLLFLSHEDKGADQIARDAGHPVAWCRTAPTDWEAYGTCLKEFLNTIAAKEA